MGEFDYDEFYEPYRKSGDKVSTKGFAKKATNVLTTFSKTLKTLTLPGYIQRNLVRRGMSMSDDMHTEVLRFFYEQLYGTGHDLGPSSINQFNPDVNGFVLLFMVPPDLSGYREWLVKNVGKKGNLRHLYDPNYGGTFMYEVGKLATFCAVDFTPPNSQVNADRITSRTGGMPYATEVMESDTFSVTYIDSTHLDIYHFHHMWIEYIRDILYGWISPDDYYLSEEFPIIDYAASFYIVKYLPNMIEPSLIAKCMGCFPQALPTKELIGTRTSNELTTLPFNYFVTSYREATWMERDHWLFKELEDQILGRFTSGPIIKPEAAPDSEQEDTRSLDSLISHGKNDPIWYFTDEDGNRTPFTLNK